MAGLFMLMWFGTLIAFVVYWWKKRKARKAGGDNYKNSPQYIQVSKIKRIIGVVCIVSFVLGIVTTPPMTPEEKARIAAERQAREEKEAAEKAAKEAEARAAREQKDIESVASLKGEDRIYFDEKFQEYKASLDEKEARAKALEDVAVFISEREAAEKKAKEAEEKAKKEAEEKEKLAEAEAKEAEEKAKKELAEREKLERDITNGWDISDLSSQKNIDKAIDIVADNANYITEKQPVWVSPEAALRKPWEYYGQVVSFSGTVVDSNQAPPGHSIAKIWGGQYTYGVLECGDVPVEFHINADSDRLKVGQRATIKGFIVGHSELTNSFGGTPKGVKFLGIVQ